MDQHERHAHQGAVVRGPHLNVTRIDARELINTVCEDLASQAKERGLSITTELEDFSLDVDRTIILSALENAVKGWER